jgi:hypothetical protein
MTLLDYLLLILGGSGLVLYLLARAEMHSRWPRTERRERERDWS